MEISFLAMISACASAIAAAASLWQVYAMQKQYNEEHQPKLFPCGLFFCVNQQKGESLGGKFVDFYNLGTLPAVNIVAQWDVPALGELNEFINIKREIREGVFGEVNLISEALYIESEVKIQDDNAMYQEIPRCWPADDAKELKAIRIVFPSIVIFLAYVCFQKNIPIPKLKLLLHYQSPAFKKHTACYEVHCIVYSENDENFIKGTFYMKKRFWN